MTPADFANFITEDTEKVGQSNPSRQYPIGVSAPEIA
jgi:hypothetical protein